jgi:hypothetical protein
MMWMRVTNPQQAVGHPETNEYNNVIVPEECMPSARPEDYENASDPQQGSAGTVYYNPDLKMKIPQTHVIIPNFIQLAHELIHVKHYNEGTRAVGVDLNTGEKLEDKQTIREEQLIREEHGLIRRKGY